MRRISSLQVWQTTPESGESNLYFHSCQSRGQTKVARLLAVHHYFVSDHTIEDIGSPRID
jgi:hypothetical protein